MRKLLYIAGACLTVAILIAQSTVPPTKTPYVDLTTGLKLNGTYGSPGTVPISTGNGTNWGTVSPGTAIPGLTSDGLSPGGIIVAGNVAAATLSGSLTGHASLDLPLTGGQLSGPLGIGSSVYFDDGATEASNRAFGAVCDGSTDDTTANQAAITWIVAHHGHLTFCAGKTNISASLHIPFGQQFRISGQAKVGTIINMTANNVPIFYADQPNTHSVEIDHLFLQYSSHQGTSNTQAYGIQWTSAASDAAGFYRWNVHDIQVDGAYIGMGIYTTAGNTETVWGTLFSHVTITNTSQSAFSFVPTVPIGMPSNVFINTGIFDTGGGAPVPAGPAIFLSAMEATFIGLDVEGWKNEAIWSTGGGFVNVTGCHVEHETLSTSGRFFLMGNGPIKLEACNLSMDGTPVLSNAQVVGGAAVAAITLKDVTMFVVPSGGSTFYWTTYPSAASLNFDNVVDALGGMTSMTGAVPLSAFALWPDQYPLLRQNQTAPQLVNMGGTNPLTSAYQMNLGINFGSPGTVYYSDASSGNWHTNWFYIDLSQVWHYQKCADVAGTTPPTTAPTGCTDLSTMTNSGIVNALGGYQVNGAATSTHFLRGSGSVFVDAAIQAGDLPAGSSVPLYNASGTLITAAHSVNVGGTLTAGTLAITFTGAAVFTNSGSYVCSPDDSSGVTGIEVTYTSGSSVTFTGTAGDAMRATCTGN